MKVSPLDKQLHRLTVTESKLYDVLRRDSEAEEGADDASICRLRQALQNTDAGLAIGQLVDHTLLRVGRGAAHSVSVEGILQSYQRRGHDVTSLDELHDLAIDDIEQVAGKLCFKYQAMAIGDGLGAGFAGLPGMLVDIPALIGLSMRAVAEIATHYGFDVTQAWEQKHALLVLTLACGEHDRREQLDQAMVASTHGSDRAPLNARLRRQVTEALVLRLVQAKVAQVVPVVGAVAGGAFNKQFVDHVCKTARNVYRERWLIERYTARVAAAE